MTKYTVLLSDDTVGTVYADEIEIGNVVSVCLNDENGCVIEATGEVVEILEAS